jgi:pimeloyl-ACP methyl ester carboxylesterase
MTRVVSSPRRIVQVDGVGLCVQTFGDSEAPPLLLIAGASSSMDWWEEGLCERLAAGSRFVIRYDHRDTGESVTYEAGAPGYDGDDLVTDAVGVLDALGVARAHVAGISMGGGIAQELALDHGERVASLVLMSTSPLGPDLPPPAEHLRKRFADPPPEPDWSDDGAVVRYLLDELHAYAGSYGVDEARMRPLLERMAARATKLASMHNHWLLEGGKPIRPRLPDIAAPTLVVHGTEDPLFPLPHGEALAREIPDARLLVLQGLGHEHPPPELWDQLVGAVLQHTADRLRVEPER